MGEIHKLAVFEIAPVEIYMEVGLYVIIPDGRS